MIRKIVFSLFIKVIVDSLDYIRVTCDNDFSLRRFSVFLLFVRILVRLKCWLMFSVPKFKKYLQKNVEIFLHLGKYLNYRLLILL